jgi:outer membrane biosynthesis protein TonB
LLNNPSTNHIITSTSTSTSTSHTGRGGECGNCRQSSEIVQHVLIRQRQSKHHGTPSLQNEKKKEKGETEKEKERKREKKEKEKREKRKKQHQRKEKEKEKEKKNKEKQREREETTKEGYLVECVAVHFLDSFEACFQKLQSALRIGTNNKQLETSVEHLATLSSSQTPSITPLGKQMYLRTDCATVLVLLRLKKRFVQMQTK